MTEQLQLLGHETPACDSRFVGIRRVDLGDGAWLELRDGWLAGHAAVFDTLLATTRWQQDRRTMFDREVDVPRLTARYPEHGPGHPVLGEVGRALCARYRTPSWSISAAYYRDGRDGVALHGDRVGRSRADCVVAILVLGAPRRFLLKPAGGGPSRVLCPGFGDLLVMGGSCQRGWRHGVPKVVHASPRISVQFRPCADPGPARRSPVAAGARHEP